MRLAMPHSMPIFPRAVLLCVCLSATAVLLFSSGCATMDRREVVLLDSRGVLPLPKSEATDIVPPTREPVYPEIQAEPLLPLEPWGDPEFKPEDEVEFEPIIPEITQPPAVESEQIVYEVAPGDSLWRISRRFGISHQELAAYNNMDLDGVIRVGQKLRIPPGGTYQPERAEQVSPPPSTPVRDARITSPSPDRELVAGDKYTVRRGDSLSVIARDFGVRVNDIKALNDLRSDVIYEGQTLVIPQRASSDGRPPRPTVREEPELPELVGDNGAAMEDDAEDEPFSERPRAVRIIPHTVIDGTETLEEIAEMYGVSLNAIHRENPDLRGRPLRPDMTVKVPVD